ncbi:MAG: hypothetical protein BWX89_00943 [candidate division TA06 bacterium ADurb.Bin131]|uniref:Glycosyl hydrolase-like 10 domain-containing protein n=1 Tax=candidate division TA06 bacterium ADurb.Bin131 TaxID=1852827 RepID=A0A1V6C9C0_UNCT6|nr:MAG: hypothetical protein BWX89_00943 [candidate division TA06 bacterium ADurb.Bin131]
MKDWEWLFSDFSSVLPVDAVSYGDSKKGVWQIADYTTDDFSGNLIIAQPTSNAPDVKVKIPLKGTYDIYLGLFQNYCDRIKVRFTTDSVFERLRHSSKIIGKQAFEEVYWKTEYFDGEKEIIIRQEPGIRASIGYIMAKRPQENNYKKEYLIHLTDDGFPSNYGVPDDLDDACWNIVACSRLKPDYVSRGINPTSMADYPTKHNSLRRDPEKLLKTEFPADIYRQCYETLAKFFSKNQNVPEKYFDIAKKSGIKVFAYCRMAMYHANPPWDCFRSDFYDKHPEFRCVDIDGVPVNRMSFAFPEVRQEFIKLFTEGVEMGADGAANCFVRGFPFVCYEEPVRKRFKQLYDEDITKLPETDSRVEEVRCEFMTEYMRELRNALKKIGHDSIINLAIVHANEDVCSYYGLDIKNWIKEDLIDILCPYTWGFEGEPANIDIEYFAKAVKKTNVKLMPFLGSMYNDKNPVEFLQRALSMSKYPVDGFSFWDGVDNRIDPMFHMVIEHLISKQSIKDAIEKLEKWPSCRILKTLQGTKINKHNYGLSM